MIEMGRRAFLGRLGLGACALAGGQIVPGVLLADDKFLSSPYVKEALFYDRLEDGLVKCRICPRECVVSPGNRGYCRVRENHDGSYYSLVHGRVCAYHVDPIEKKPLFHFLPGTTAFSIATVGCNLACKFCQNWEISQETPENVSATNLPPESVASAARKYDSPTIAYTYTDPNVFYEFVLDCARAGHDEGLRSVVISAGYLNRAPLVELIPNLDAIKIDLKGFTEEFYCDVCGASLKPVLETLSTIKEKGLWLEIVNLMIPTLNDDEKDVDAMCKWIVENLGTDVPVHFTRFYPKYKLNNLPPTPVSTVERAREIALARGIKFPYVGNVPTGNPGESTYCPGCGEVVIKRAGYAILSNNLKDGKCGRCGAEVPGVWS
jgi:pyruvate formate lyase activating enzyme